MKNKLKTTSFWLGIGGAVVLIVESISKLFEFNIATSKVEEIVISVCSILVMLGIVTKKKTTDLKDYSEEELLEEVENHKKK